MHIQANETILGEAIIKCDVYLAAETCILNITAPAS